MKHFKMNSWIVFVLMIGFLSGSVTMTSCSDDDDGNQPPKNNNEQENENENDDNNNDDDGDGDDDGNNNEFGSGTFEITLGGVLQGQVQGNEARYADSATTNRALLDDSDATLSVVARDTSENINMQIVIYKNDADQITEDTYRLQAAIGMSSGKGCYVTFSKGIENSYTTGSAPTGSVKITNISDNKVKGEINDITLIDPATGPDYESISINGTFEATPTL